MEIHSGGMDTGLRLIGGLWSSPNHLEETVALNENGKIYNMEKGTDKKIRKWKVGNCLGMIGVNADLVQSERWAAKWPVVERWWGFE